jgi:UDP-N-acetyl-D-glucosamine dehydrogenase
VWQSVTLTDDLLRGVDVAVVVTNHSNLDYRRILELAPIVVDTRNATRATGGPAAGAPGGWIVKGWRG